MLSFLKKILFAFVLVIIIIIGYFVYYGYDMYKCAVNEISIEDKISQIKSKPNYTELKDISRCLYRCNYLNRGPPFLRSFWS